MRLGRAWQLVAADASTYSTAPMGFALLRAALGGTEGDKYTSHPPKNMMQKAAIGLSADRRKLNNVGHMPSSPKMPQRYDRSARANELLLRIAVVQRMREGMGDNASAPPSPSGVWRNPHWGDRND